MWKRRHHSKLWPYGIGEPFDLRTFRGCWSALVFFCVATYFMWHFDEIFAWYKVLKGDTNYRIDPAKQSWAQLWAVIIGGTGILTPVIGMIMIPINRRRAREYDEDQRRQRDAQTRKPEDDSDPPPQTTSKPVWPEQDEPPAEDPVWNDEPQEPVGIQTPPKAEPPERFGNVRLEKSDGRATLVVPKKHS